MSVAVESVVVALRQAGVVEIVIVVREGAIVLAGQAEYVARALAGWGEDALASQIERLRSADQAVVIDVREQRATVRREPVIELNAPGGVS
jgi:hypothetical protein